MEVKGIVRVFRKSSPIVGLPLVVLFVLSVFSLQAAAQQSKGAQKSSPAKVGKDKYSGIFPEVVAKVGDMPVYGRDLENEVRKELLQMGSPNWRDLKEDYRGQLVYSILTNMINSKLLFNEAVAKGVSASDSEVQDEYLKLTERFKDEADMNAYLDRLKIDKATVVNELHKSLVISKFVDQAIRSRIAVTPEMMQKYYAEHKAEFKHPDIVRTSQIVIQSDGAPESDAKAKKQAEDILARIKKGENFADLARKYSTGPSAPEGGDIGFYSKESMPAEYAEVAFSLPVGESKMISSDQGYRIIKVTDKKNEGTASFEESEGALRDFLKEELTQTEVLKLVNALRDRSEIDYLIPAGVPLNP